MTTESPHAEFASIAFSPRRLGHFNLWVGDLERSDAFYQGICGLHLVFEEPGVEARFYSNGNSHHDLALMQTSHREHIGRDGHKQVAASRGTTPGLNHLAFEMTSEEDLVGALRRAEAAGYTVERTVDHQIARSAYLRDPDSFFLEMYTDASEHFSVSYGRLGGELLTEIWDPFAATPSDRENFITEPDPLGVDSAVLHPVRAARATLTVADLERSIAYYTGVVGFQLLGGGVGSPGAVLGGRLGYPDLLLLEACGADPAVHHLGFELPAGTDLDAAAAGLDAAGVRIDRRVASDTKRSLVVRDPDGLSIEFFVPGTLDLDASSRWSPEEWQYLI